MTTQNTEVNCTEKDEWISKGFQYNPSWGWHKAAPKKSL